MARGYSAACNDFGAGHEVHFDGTQVRVAAEIWMPGDIPVDFAHLECLRD